MMSANSSTSVEVGRFIFIATAKPAIWAGVAAPVMIWSIAHPAYPLGRLCSVVRRPRMSGHVGAAAEPEAGGN